LKKQTSFKIGAVTLLILSISLVALGLHANEGVKTPLKVELTALPSASLNEPGTEFQEKSALSVSEQLENVSDGEIVNPEDIIFVNESTEECNEYNIETMTEEEMIFLDLISEKETEEVMNVDYGIFVEDFVNMDHEQFINEYKLNEVKK